MTKEDEVAKKKEEFLEGPFLFSPFLLVSHNRLF